MNKYRSLSGYELVAKGITKHQATLPELGLKDVSPNGSWLEQKQIQSAIEARKHLIESDRIEKSGMLSHAEWRENLMLAEVTQKSGGHWQFVGHNVCKRLFLYPEEALFLMEVNCLLLKHHEIKVSLQQAYSLLLRDRKSVIQYKVYASLSRLGYKVFRHKEPTPTKFQCDEESVNVSVKEDSKATSSKEINKLEVQTKGTDIENDITTKAVLTSCEKLSSGHLQAATFTSCDESQNIPAKDNNDPFPTLSNKSCQMKRCTSSIYRRQIQRLKKRLLKPCDSKKLHKYFKNLPDLLNNQTMCIKVPEKAHVPNNISFNKSIYTLNLEHIRAKCTQPPSTDAQVYGISDEVNGAHIRRVGSVSENVLHCNNPSTDFTNLRASTSNTQFRPFSFWRPRTNANYFQFSMSFQRPMLPNMFFGPRYPFYPRFQNYYGSSYMQHNQGYGNFINNFRKRSKDKAKRYYFDCLKKLAARLRNIFRAGHRHPQNMEALQRLIQTYNNRYKSNVRLSDNIEIIEEVNIFETIELDVDEETRSKKPRLDESRDTYTDNFNGIKQLANRLKVLENGHKATARHRRALSNLVKTFNKSYNADIYVNGNYEVLDRRYITLDCSSSDSDCVIDEAANTSSGKKLRNPFNVLKRLSEKQNKSIDDPSTSTENVIIDTSTMVKDNTYNEITLKCFNENWLPNENDFGRAEIASGDMAHNIENTEDFVYEYMKIHPRSYESWLDLKVSFLCSLEETTKEFQREMSKKADYKSIVKPEDCTDMVSVLNKLSVIKPNKVTLIESSLIVNFDVYNRDVQNFRKTNPPTPHFRIVCLEESSSFPSGEEIAALYLKYNDSVSIVFAIVGVGSINFLQINNTELPMFIYNNMT